MPLYITPFQLYTTRAKISLSPIYGAFLFELLFFRQGLFHYLVLAVLELAYVDQISLKVTEILLPLPPPPQFWG